MNFRFQKALLWTVAGIAFPLWAVAASQEQGPPRELSGFVRSTDGRPILGATVILETVAGEVLQQISPEGSGRFVFTSLDGGIYYVRVNALGFRERRERADLLSSRRATLYFTMQPAPSPTTGNEIAPGPAVNQRLLRIPEVARKEFEKGQDRKSTRLNSSHIQKSRMPSSA